MSQEIVAPPAASYSWSETWIKALTQPSVEAYEAIVNDPKAGPGRACIWVAIGYALGGMIQIILGSTPGFSQPGSESMAGASISTLTCLLPAAAASGVLGLVFIAGVSQMVAKMLGGTGTFSKLVYANAAYMAPLSIIGPVVGSIPVVKWLVIPFMVYIIVLNVIAVKAVHRFGWGKAIASSVLILYAILILVGIVMVGILALLGPTIGKILSNTIQNI